MLFYICLNLSAYIINEADFLIVSGQPYVSPSGLASIFSLDTFSIVATFLGGGLIGLAAVLTRQYTYAAGAILIWVLGIMFKITKGIFIGFPEFLGNLLPSELSYLKYIVVAFSAFIFFIFMIEIATQRQIT